MRVLIVEDERLLASGSYGVLKSA